MFKMFGDSMTDLIKNAWEKIVNSTVDLTNIQEVMISRISAIIHAKDIDSQTRTKAIDFIKNTSTEFNKPHENDRLTLKSMTAFNIITFRASDDLNIIVYKIACKNNPDIYEIAFFNRRIDGCVIFSHKLNLAKLYTEFCVKDGFKYAIRQIGDPILHRAAREVECFLNNVELVAQLSILKRNLCLTGGVGIAANQCSEIENPLKLILSGVDYDNPEHIVKAITRYQTALFPRMKVLINPVIVKLDEELSEFTEGCLSVRGTIRGVVKRPKSVTVRYQDLNGKFHEEHFNGTDARVMLHELDHILNGYVYLQRLIDELTTNQKYVLKNIVETILRDNSPRNNSELFLSPVTIFNRDESGCVVFDEQKVREVFSGISTETLTGILAPLASIDISNKISS